MSLLRMASRAPGWHRAVNGQPDMARAFAFPYLGHPVEHPCTELRSRRLTASVVLATWNSAGSLRRCLDSLELASLNRSAPDRLEVIVCDDGSTDRTWHDLRDNHRNLNLTVLRLDHRGQSFALNVGIERSEGDVVVVCDSDMVLGCGALDEMLARHELWPDVVCCGFRTDIDPAEVPDESAGLLDLTHREAVSGDTRLAFHMPTILANMLAESSWLTRLEGQRHLLDCEGSVWRRHRFLFGCLFSARRDLLAVVGGMPEVVPRWGYQDTLVAAGLEAHGGFLLPVTTAWGHHVSHQIRHADQWFQYDRNRLAYEYVLDQEAGTAPWRVHSRRPALLAEHSTQATGTVASAMRPISAAPTLEHALGRWEQFLSSPAGFLDGPLCAECLFRTGRDEELVDGPGDSFWRAAALARRGRPARARQALEHAEAGDPAARYVLSASTPELLRLADHHQGQELHELAELYRLAARSVNEP